MDVEDRPDIEFRGVLSEGDERLNTEPPSSDRPVLKLLNLEIRSAEPPGPTREPAKPREPRKPVELAGRSPTREPRRPVSELARPSLRRG
jgi:hypothetical protein